MRWWGKDRRAAADTRGQPRFPETAYSRRRRLGADIKLGSLELWVGVGRNQSWPWLDIAARVGKGWGVFVDHHAPMIKRPDFAAFLPHLRDFAEGRADEVTMQSTGGSMRLTLRRDEPGWLRGEAHFTHGPNSQTVRFSLWDDSVREAVPAFEAAVARIEAAWTPRWTPKLGKFDMTPRAALLEKELAPSQFKAWESGLGNGADVRFDYEIDGYGWYNGTITVGEERGYFGGGYLTDAKGDLIRAALLLLTGKQSAEVMCHAEPGLTRIEFQTVTLRMAEGPEPGVPGAVQEGCWIRIREIDYQTGEEKAPEFEALARSVRAVVEAIYQMGVRVFEDDGGPWSDAMAALEGALASVPREPGD